MARMVSCGRPCCWVQTVRVYWGRLLLGLSASARVGRTSARLISLKSEDLVTSYFSIPGWRGLNRSTASIQRHADESELYRLGGGGWRVSRPAASAGQV